MTRAEATEGGTGQVTEGLAGSCRGFVFSSE